MWAQAWEISCHVAHLYQHYLEDCNIFITFLGRLGPVPPPTHGLVPVHHQDWGELPSDKG